MRHGRTAKRRRQHPLETEPGAVRDAGIIAASQKIEHYEIASYGTLCAFAKTLGENDAAKLLTQTLAEEKEADCLLNDIALNIVILWRQNSYPRICFSFLGNICAYLGAGVFFLLISHLMLKFALTS